MVLVTRQAPDFTAAAVLGNGEIVEKFNFKQHTSGKATVLFFWPMDFTFVCPTELGDVADHYEELQKLGVDVYSVSTDTHFTHKAWHSSSETIAKIKYAMIGDPSLQISTDFEVLREGQGLADRGLELCAPWSKPTTNRMPATYC